MSRGGTSHQHSWAWAWKCILNFISQITAREMRPTGSSLMPRKKRLKHQPGGIQHIPFSFQLLHYEPLLFQTDGDCLLFALGDSDVSNASLEVVCFGEAKFKRCAAIKFVILHICASYHQTGNLELRHPAPPRLCPTSHSKSNRSNIRSSIWSKASENTLHLGPVPAQVFRSVLTWGFHPNYHV